jgi:hypothetical protein
MTKPTTNITRSHKKAFVALTSGHYHNFALVSCFVNGEPAAAIAAIREDDGCICIQPLFVSITPAMILTNHDDEEPWHERPSIS